MAGRKVMSNAVALVALLVVVAAAAAGAVQLCGVDESQVEACRPYCTVGSTEAAPSQDCCVALRNAKFGCLCKYKSWLPSDIDPARVMQIPSKRNIPGVPVKC